MQKKSPAPFPDDAVPDPARDHASPGPKVARGFLLVFAFLSHIACLFIAGFEVFGSLATTVKAFESGGEKIGVLVYLSLAAVDVATLCYQRQGAAGKGQDPRINRRILIFTLLSVAAGVAQLIVNDGQSPLRDPLSFAFILMAYRGPFILASGLSYLLHRIPWHGNLPPGQ